MTCTFVQIIQRSNTKKYPKLAVLIILTSNIPAIGKKGKTPADDTLYLYSAIYAEC